LIGNHTFSHPNLRKLSEEEVRKEIKTTHDPICEVTGSCALFRPPYGATNETVRKVLGEFGYQQVLWSVDSLDWKYKKEAQWVDHAMGQIRERQNSVVLMHDIHSSTVNNVNKLIAKIKNFPNCVFDVDV